MTRIAENFHNPLPEVPGIHDQPYLPDRAAADVHHRAIKRPEELCDLCGIDLAVLQFFTRLVYFATVVPCYCSASNLKKRPIRRKVVCADRQEHPRNSKEQSPDCLL